MASSSSTEASPTEIDALVVGGDGMLGARTAGRLAAAGLSVHATTRRQETATPDRPFIDLAAGRWESLAPAHYRTAILCAAAARLADCRNDPEGTAAVNVTGTVALARWLAERGTRVLFLSTNQVFDGRLPEPRPAEAPYSPITEYGRQKAAAEEGILPLRGAAVLRLTKVVHPGMPLFDGWAAELRAGRPIEPFGDFHFAPVSADLVTEVLLRLCAHSVPEGIWQLSAPADVTYADAARQIAARLGCDPALVRPVHGVAHKVMGGDRPPAWSALDCSRLRRDLGIEPPPALQTVADCVAP